MERDVPGVTVLIERGDVIETTGGFVSEAGVEGVGVGVTVGDVGVGVGVGVAYGVPVLLRVNAFRQTLAFWYAVERSVQLVPLPLTKLSPLPARAPDEKPEMGYSTGTGYLFPGVFSLTTIENRSPFFR
jgi:hypothetical protein